jgi:Ring finger domain
MSYTIQILNDLHELYPDILYNPSRFQSGEDVINYIVERGIHHPYEQEYAQYQAARAQREQREQLEQRLQRIEQAHAQQQEPQAPQAPQVEEVQPPAPEPAPRQVVRNVRLSARELQEDWEREMYGAVVWRPWHDPNYVAPISIPDSQTSSVARLLSSLIDDGIMSGQRLSNPLRPTTEQLRRSTTVRALTENADDVCHICHDGMLNGQSVRTINHCNHMFHQLCIDTWFSSRPTCPTCRHDVRTA